MSTETLAPLGLLGRYQLKRVLGRGAMGLVYEGLDPRLARRVAIKTILRGHLLDPALAADYSARFVREAQAAGRLNHPHIVTVFDFGEQDDVAYLVMELIEGRELAAHFDAGERFSLPEAVRIMGELLDALHYAHERGIVHRDVKPANVILDQDRRVKLADFGVARLSDAQTERTQPGTLVGTPSYMSPEQIQGLAVGSRTDLFAAGIVLYQFLTQQKPFTGGGMWTIQKRIVQDEPLPPSRADATLPPVFDAVVQRALQKDPAQRYATAAEFAAELRAALARASPEPAAIAAAPRGAAPRATLPAAGDPDATVLRPQRAAAAPSRQAPAAGWPTPPLRPAQRRRQLAAAALGAATLLVGAGWLWRLQGGAAVPAAPVPGSAHATAGAPVASPSPAPAPAQMQPVAAPPPGPPTEPPPAPPSQPPAPRPTQPAPPARAAAATAVDAAPRRAEAARAGPSRHTAPANPRCSGLLQRIQLGETLSGDDLTAFQTECRR